MGITTMYDVIQQHDERPCYRLRQHDSHSPVEKRYGSMVRIHNVDVLVLLETEKN